jgi:hypothetical protein
MSTVGGLGVTTGVVGDAVLDAEQYAVVPPFDPPQFQFQGPLPLTLEAAPEAQRLVVGATKKVTPLEVPQEP